MAGIGHHSGDRGRASLYGAPYQENPRPQIRIEYLTPLNLDPRKEDVATNEIDAELKCDYCHKKSGNPPSGWCKINKAGITVCPACLLGHWDELKETFLADNLNVEYLT